MKYETTPRNLKNMTDIRLKQELIACSMWLNYHLDQMTAEEIAVCTANKIAIENLMRERGLDTNAD